MALHIKANGTETVVHPTNGVEFSLEELQNFVGGYIELVFTKENKEMYVNEEGLLKNLPLNDKATYLLAHRYGLQGIHGDVIICEKGEAN
jgi:hypothetical protein